ncbi:MAG: hypothetical protein QGH93_02410 [Gammaproteobacteria bacterium]|jgi:hypothetical protein|nr:hypothetical protein [Chromatiales bacterium]MDP6673693.1 hypothetical protein [Gammaproteobacteria bacterium]
MYSWWLLLIGVPVGIVAAWYFLRAKTTEEVVSVRREQKKSASVVVTKNQPRKQAQRYYGVSVQVDNNPCEAIKAIADHRYLSDEAPRLPLADCDRDDCRCM